ncbi:caspase-1-like isoform X1 [Venturia canescens]|uniref:caspase-1-like isoform X1 n=1 Tax=Venturia canescens TaxID=32260 RepID=UPI001C9C3506|nr:caspase-1-like isoform X1 [Venturia canescens]
MEFSLGEEEPEKVPGEDDTEEDDSASDNEMRTAGAITEKRRRRVSDVIDRQIEFEDSVSEGFTTPRRHGTEVETTSPDQGYCTTPDSHNLFMPDWLHKTRDLSDATPNTFGEASGISRSCSNSTTNVTAPMPVPIDAERYNMNHKNRGKCIVFNHEYFDTGFEDRVGSTVDAKKIQQTFLNLGFEVEILDNLVHVEVIDKITKLSEEDHGDSDCICIFVLTHGLSNDMIFAKDVAYKADKIWKPFTADKCKSLAGKPKLFFLQACRGDELDDGVTLMARSRRYGNSETDSIVTSYKIPTHADFLIAHSSAQGFYSWRNPTKGTWFVQCLCEVLDGYADTTDLLKMLTITARKISTELESYNDLNPTQSGRKQVPSITTMLLRDIYFTPK